MENSKDMDSGVRVFISGHSGNQKMEEEQQRVCRVLDSRGLAYVTVDISAPGMQGQKNFMRERGKRKEGQRHVLPPQIFNGELYRGDFDDFDTANEDDILEEFLGLDRKYPKIEPIKTGARERRVGRLPVGKLDKREEELYVRVGNKKEEKEKHNVEVTRKPQVRKKSFAVEDAFEVRIDEVEELDKENENPAEANETFSEVNDWRDLKVSFVKISFARFVEIEREESFTDTSDEEDEDSEPEYMEDGERRRKTSRGFKLLNNCGRFWKASQYLGRP